VKLVDASVLLYAVHQEAEQHMPALAWPDRTMSSTDTVLLP
jgi:predicted nucleic acid-binding protein